jgi:hypothetical protein
MYLQSIFFGAPTTYDWNDIYNENSDVSELNIGNNNIDPIEGTDYRYPPY